ncbi:hypothetical protein CU044_5849 [Streptomyces sp. L-9-10]|nr:hypothetical protein CU044_5849 [Streptomyces sp. L-9-10]
MSWGTVKTGGGAEGERAGGEDPRIRRTGPGSSADTAQPGPGPKHGK